MLRTDDIELKEINKKKTQARWEKAQSAFGIAGLLNLGVVFTSFIKQQEWFVSLIQVGKGLLIPLKYIFFPLAAAFDIAHAVFAWRQVYAQWNKPGQTRRIINAVIETVAALAITTAVIGSLIAEIVGVTLLAAMAPFIFVSVLGLKSLEHAFTAFALFISSRTSIKPATSSLGIKFQKFLGLDGLLTDDVEKNKKTCRDLSKGHAVSAVTLAFATVAVGILFLAAATPPVSFIGIGFGLAAVAVGISYSIHTFVKKFREEAASKKKIAANLEIKPDENQANTDRLVRDKTLQNQQQQAEETLALDSGLPADRKIEKAALLPKEQPTQKASVFCLSFLRNLGSREQPKKTAYWTGSKSFRI